MNIHLSELQVIENRAITKRIAGILGEEINNIETYALTASPDGNGDYMERSITPVSFDYFNGIVIKSDGISECDVNDSSMLIGKSFVLNGPYPMGETGTITIKPMYKIIDRGTVSAATEVGEGGTGVFDLTITGKNYLYSSVVGTPVTGKLNVIGRSFILTAAGRMAQIIIDVVLQEGDVLSTMTSDEYNARVAEEIQRKINFFFGEAFAACSYDTITKCYKIVLLTAGATAMAVTASSMEDLSYFGMVAPTISLGSEALAHPRVVMMTGGLIGMDGYPCEITAPDTIRVTVPVEETPAAEDFVDQLMILGNAEAISYEMVIYQ